MRVTVKVYTSHNYIFLRECCSSSSTRPSSWLIFSSFALIILSKSLIFFSFDAFVCLTSSIDLHKKFSDDLISLMSFFKSSPAWFYGGMMLITCALRQSQYDCYLFQ